MRNPIGIFDSGYGGLTILRDILEKLPQYDYIYLGDNARSPYGARSFETVYGYTREAVTALFGMGCHLIIIACNTASAKALRNIQQFDLPKIAPTRRVLGVIRPSAEAAGNFTKTGHIGVLGTNGTVNSGSYLLEIKKLFPEIIVNQEACPMWVPLVENNEHLGDGADYFVKKYIDSLLSRDSMIDTIILGCTHYPLLFDKIRKYVPENIKIVPQGKIIADSLKNYLTRHPEIENTCSKEGSCKFLTTENADIFEKQGGQFLNREIKAEKYIFFEKIDLFSPAKN